MPTVHATGLGIQMSETVAAPAAPEPSRRVLLEQRLRRRSLRWTRRTRRLDRRPRCDPDFIVVGAQKAGTTSLFAYLAAHREIDRPLVKEINYFSLWPDRGQAWYRRNFPLDRPGRRITGEASPMYMVHPLALQRIAHDLPAVKVVAILREPVSRLVSHYRHSVRLGHESLPLDVALRREDDRVADDLERLAADPFHSIYVFQRFSYLRRSLYLDQVTRMIDLFGDRAMFLRLEDLTSPDALRPLCEFLGVSFDPDAPFQAHNVNSSVGTPTEDLLPAEVVERIKADAEATCALLGWESWYE